MKQRHIKINKAGNSATCQTCHRMYEYQAHYQMIVEETMHSSRELHDDCPHCYHKPLPDKGEELKDWGAF